MTLGQRVAVMRDGRILQVDAPQRLYEQPRDLFVAGFIGSPAMNLVDATIDGDEVVFGQFRVPLDPGRRPTPRLGSARRARDQAGELRGRGVRARELPTIEVEVVVLEELGSDAHVFFPVDAPRITPEAIEAEGEDDASSSRTRTRSSTPASTRARQRASASRCGSRSTRRASTSSIPRRARACSSRARLGREPGPGSRTDRRLVLTTRLRPLGLVPS